MPAEWQQYLTCELTPDGVVQLGLDTKRLSGSRGLRINKGQLTAVVSLPKLSLLKCSSGAVIRCTGIFKGGTVQLRASSGGMVDGLSLKASEALIDASSGGGIRNVAVTAPKAGVEISSGAVAQRGVARCHGTHVPSLFRRRRHLESHRKQLDAEYLFGRCDPDYRFDSDPDGQQVPFRRKHQYRRLHSVLSRAIVFTGGVSLSASCPIQFLPIESVPGLRSFRVRTPPSPYVPFFIRSRDLPIL